jgi:hypothetical protein
MEQLTLCKCRGAVALVSDEGRCLTKFDQGVV